MPHIHRLALLEPSDGLDRQNIIKLAPLLDGLFRPGQTAAPDETIHKLRARYGRKVVYFGSVQDNRQATPMRISFTHIPDLKLEQGLG
jgi:hypothetical protein